jgi:hypothetical protein
LPTERVRKLEMFADYLESKCHKPKHKPSENNKAINQIPFPECFVNNDVYNQFIQLMVEKGHLSEENHAWIDTKKGNKSLLVAIIKSLRSKGYYREDIKLTDERIQEICSGEFNLPIGINTVKKAQPGKFDLSFISTVPKKID